MYNENVLKWCGSMYYGEDIDLLIDDCDEIVVYDDSNEWYNNIDESEADV